MGPVVSSEVFITTTEAKPLAELVHMQLLRCVHSGTLFLVEKYDLKKDLRTSFTIPPRIGLTNQASFKEGVGRDT